MIDINNESTWPPIGSLWQHRNGNEYRVVMFTNKKFTVDYPVTIVYVNTNNGLAYSRRLDDWSRSMTKLND